MKTVKTNIMIQNKTNLGDKDVVLMAKIFLPGR